jgi:hypothetical protein
VLLFFFFFLSLSLSLYDFPCKQKTREQERKTSFFSCYTLFLESYYFISVRVYALTLFKSLKLLQFSLWSKKDTFLIWLEIYIKNKLKRILTYKSNENQYRHHVFVLYNYMFLLLPTVNFMF